MAYAVKELSRDVTAPTQESLAKMKHVLRYLAGSKQAVLRLRPNVQLADWRAVVDIECLVDSDWAGCAKTRRSTSGSCVTVLGSSVTSTSRTQATVALSSGEAELYAIGQGVSEALFVRSMLLESGLTRKAQITVHTDSTAGKSIATRFGAGKRTKHVDLRYLYMQQLVSEGLIQIKKIHTLQNCADVLTKYVGIETLRRLSPLLGVITNCF